MYQATSPYTDLPCVVKVLRTTHTQNPSVVKRFRREIQLTRQLSSISDHIVKIFDDGESPQLGVYYVMEHLEGMDLQTFHHRKKARSIQEIFYLFMQICEALSVAHTHGVIHRDLKPENVYVLPRGENEWFVKLLDFGVAKALNHHTQNHLTNGALGTPSFMPPEQFLNQEIDERSDIYSLGIMLYELLTNKLPFNHRDITQLMFQHLQEEPPSLLVHKPDLPIGLDKVVRKALAKLPEDRYSSVQAFWKALTPFSLLSEEILSSSSDWLAYDETMEFLGSLGKTDEEKKSASTRDKALPTRDWFQPDESPVLPFREDCFRDYNHYEEAWAVTNLPDGSLHQEVPEPPQPPTPEPTALPKAVFLMVTLLLGGFLGFYTFHQSTPQPKTKAAAQPAAPTKKHEGKTASARLGRSSLAATTQTHQGVGTTDDDDEDETDNNKAVDSENSSESVRPRAQRRRRRPKVRKWRTKPRKLQTIKEQPIAPRKTRERSVIIEERQKPKPRENFCGQVRQGMRWVVGRAPQSVLSHISVEFSGCTGCLIKRKGALMCLLVPRKKVNVRLSAQGYMACSHSIGKGQSAVHWKLKESNNETLIEESYTCFH